MTWNIGQRLENANFGRRTEDGFSGKPRQTLELFKKFSAMLQFAINFFEVLLKSQSNVIFFFSSVVNVECSTVKYSTGDNIMFEVEVLKNQKIMQCTEYTDLYAIYKYLRNFIMNLSVVSFFYQKNSKDCNLFWLLCCIYIMLTVNEI